MCLKSESNVKLEVEWAPLASEPHVTVGCDGEKRVLLNVNSHGRCMCFAKRNLDGTDTVVQCISNVIHHGIHRVRVDYSLCH